MSYTYDTINIGDGCSVTRFLSAEDVQVFAELTGDRNPIHIDEEAGKASRFGTRVVHGVLLLGIISKVLAEDYPGPGCIAVAMSVRFLRPVPVDSEIRVEVKVAEKIEKRRHVKAKVYIYMTETNKMVLAGDAVMLPPGEE